MANVAKLDLQCARGEARTFTGTHYTTAAQIAVVDITTWTIVVTVRDIPRGNVLFSKNGSVISGPAGTYSFSFTTTETTLEPADYPMDIWRTTSGSETLMGLGTLTIVDEVRI